MSNDVCSQPWNNESEERTPLSHVSLMRASSPIPSYVPSLLALPKELLILMQKNRSGQVQLLGTGSYCGERSHRSSNEGTGKTEENREEGSGVSSAKRLPR